ncbi:MAG: hypothetical protein IPK99_08720 [Flavobacteriales bacterium]|nr:hypothetical protein [Flavobacteriales bacterium]
MTILLTTLLLSSILPVDSPATLPIQWSFSASTSDGDLVEVHLDARIEPGWHIYALELPRDDGPLPTVVRIAPGMDHDVRGAVQEPQPVEEMDPNFGMLVRHHSGAPRFGVTIVRRTVEAFDLHGEVEYMMCNDKTCLPPVAVPFKLNIPASSK